MRVGRVFLVLYALITAIIISVPFLIFAWEDTQSVHTRVYWYRTDAGGDLEAFVTYSLDDEYQGMRDKRYPIAVVQIQKDELWYAPIAGRARGASSNRKLMVVATEYSFTIRIRDGEGERADGGIWDFPPLDQRVPKKIEPGSIADEALKGHSDEMRAMMEDILDGIPNPGDEIEAFRRDALVGAVQRALREDGFGWVADGIDAGSWSRGGVGFVDVLKLVGGVVVLIGSGVVMIGGVVVIDRVAARRERSRAP